MTRPSEHEADGGPAQEGKSGAVEALPILGEEPAAIEPSDGALSRDEGGRHLEVRVGNAEADTGGRQVFAAVAGSETDLVAVIGRTLDSVGRTGTTVLTGFTAGCAGLRSILAAAGVTAPPILDWFHVAMRLQHLEQTAGALSTDTPARQEAKVVIIAAADRLR